MFSCISPVLASLFLAVCVIPSAAQDCIEYDEYLEWIWQRPEMARALAYRDGLLFTLNGDNSSYLRILDATGTPIPVGAVSVGDGDPVDLALVGDHVVAATNRIGGPLVIIDAGNPGSPAVVAEYDLGSTFRAGDLDADGSLVYVVGGNDGLRILDLSDPASPQPISEFLEPGSGICVRGDIAYLCGGSVVRALDVSNPETPAELWQVTLDTYLWTRRIWVEDEVAYVTDSSGLWSVPLDPADGDPVRLGIGYEYASSGGLFAEGERLYCANGVEGLLVLDLSDPFAPSFIGSLHDPDTSGEFRAEQAIVADGRCFVAGNASGLHEADVDYDGPPAVLRILDSWAGRSRTADVEGNHVVTVADEHVYVNDLGGTGPGWSYDLPAQGISRFLDATHIVSAVGGDGLRIHEIDSEAESAFEVGSFTDPTGGTFVVDVEGSIAFVGTYGLQLVDLTHPSNPTLLSFVNDSWWMSGIDAVGDVVFVLPFIGGGLRAFDVSNPTAPFLLDELTDQPQAGLDVHVVGDLAFLACGTAGLVIVDVSDPSEMTLLTVFPTEESARKVQVIEEVAYVSTDRGLEMIYVGAPLDPVFLTRVYPPGTTVPWEVRETGEGILVTGGAPVVLAPPCGATSSIPTGGTNSRRFLSVPNPSSGPTVIALGTTGIGGPATLELIDVGGRVVRRLPVQAGEISVTWDTRDEDGRSVPSGTYFGRILGDGAGVTSIRVVR